MSEYIFLLPIALSFSIGVVSPGPSFFLIVQTAMSNSRKKAIFMSFGMGASAALFALIASTGLYIVLTKIPVLFFAFKILGGTYLIYLSYKMLKHAKQDIKTTPLHVNKKSDNFKSFMTGFLSQMANPKTAVIIGGIIAAFLPQDTPNFTYLFICIIAFMLDSTWYSLVSLALSTKKAQNAYLKYKNYINYTSSFLIAAIGIKLAFF